MVIDLLDLARLQSGRVKLSVRQIDLAEVAAEAIATIRPLCDEKGQTVRLVAPKRSLAVHADRQRLGQVLLNLLSNAHKYTPAGGEITVRLRRRGPEAVVAVEDNGPGISLEEQERIFERFYRPENGSTQANVGTGLGLPIAKALIELHGGRIWLQSEPGQGSAFFVAVPRECAPAVERGFLEQAVGRAL
jgi:signal transduction histidine kinase